MLGNMFVQPAAHRYARTAAICLAVSVAAMSVAADDLRVEASRVAHVVAFASGSTYYGASPDKFERPLLVSPTVQPADYSQPYANDGTSVQGFRSARHTEVPHRRFGAYYPDTSYVYGNDGTRVMSIGNPRNPQQYVTFRGLYGGGPWGFWARGWYGGYVPWYRPFYFPYPAYSGAFRGPWSGWGI